MTVKLSIDFVSDVSCPWCVVGLRGLEQALASAADAVTAEITFQPFELNPQMPGAGQDLDEHLFEKYGATPEQFAGTRAALQQRAEELGFTFRMDRRNRIYNTFDAHRLLHWAGHEGRQRELKHALFAAYFTAGESPADHAVLLRAAAAAGLDTAQAAAVLAENRFADEVRAAERHFMDAGIHAVPAVIVNGRHLIQGGQPPAVFEDALRRIAAGEAG